MPINQEIRKILSDGIQNIVNAKEQLVEGTPEEPQY